MQYIFKFSWVIYGANQIFAKKGIETFNMRIEKIGIDRNSANIAIRKYKLYLETENSIEKLKKNRNIKKLAILKNVWYI